MTLDKKVLEDPLKTFDFLSEKVYSDAHPTSPEFIRKMRKMIEETPDKTIQYTLLAGYVMLLEKDIYVSADLNRMRIVCEVEAYLKKRNKLHLQQPRRKHSRE